MILVTGGAGYFGEAVVRALLARGEQVRVFDLNPLEGFPSVENVQGDIRDYDAVRAACEGVRVVHHNVAQVPLAKDSALFWSVNEGGTQNILQASRAAGVEKLVYTSSSAVYGVPASNPVTEATPPAPREAYGRAKLAGEQACWATAEQGLPVSVVRPRTILGRGRLGIFQILFDWVSDGFNVPVLAGGHNIYQFIHPDDLAEACVRAGETPGSDLYNVGTDRFGTMSELLSDLCDYANTGSRVRSLPRRPVEWGIHLTSKLGVSPLGPYHALMYGRSLYFDSSKAERELGWGPRYSSSEMMREAYDWYRAHAKTLGGPGQRQSAHRSRVKQGVLALVKRAL